MAPRRIVGFHTDEEGQWVADLECGHGQHVRHDPPWQVRPWVLAEEGRARFIGTTLDCVKCEMSDRRISFEHDGHRFEAVEREHAPAGPPSGERQFEWVVRMDGNQVLEFHGAYPYRDADVRKRVLEWYGIQRG
jgi:hypothetical protein